MSRYDNENYDGGNRQRDLVLASNEWCLLQSKTNGAIKTYTGPITMTISAQESLVTFNPKTKRFEETSDFSVARQLVVTAPENWYIVLKNPAKDDSHPESAKAVISPELNIGKKKNIAGPCHFSLFPGQMAKVIKGHQLRSNQYLLARVYDAAAAQADSSNATIVDAEGNEAQNNHTNYYSGQLLIIKGTEVSFYIPPTGIEVVPINGEKEQYIREAVTLERLEYAILKDENGNKRYCHGPSVVFPEPTETFIETPKGGNIFRALELSPISGIYIKVIAPYVDKNGKSHEVGEELFITGNDQMIYYPQPEHALIQYDGKYMHHAIAIPEGEGRYILNRLTGEITTIKGPKMYLPDPRTEVVVKRKLSPTECNLFYPGNAAALAYNEGISEKNIERLSKTGGATAVTDAINSVYSTASQESTLAIFEATSKISRGTSYTKPRTITLDTKYEGVVNINVWSGYAINVVSKNGERETIVGPASRLLDYDETLEVLHFSKGVPKSDSSLTPTVYLQTKNNKVTDLITVKTKDFVSIKISLSYFVDFLEEYKDKWFTVENYVKILCDKGQSLIKQEAKKYNIEEFYTNLENILREVMLNKDNQLFEDNGMFVKDINLHYITVTSTEIADYLNNRQKDMIIKSLELSKAEKEADIVKKIAEYQQEEKRILYETKQYELEAMSNYEMKKIFAQTEIEKQEKAKELAEKKATADLQDLLDTIAIAENQRKIDAAQVEIDYEKKQAEIYAAKQKAYAETIKDIISSISPELTAALSTKANASLLETATKNMSAYAIANNESIADTVNKLLRGTSLEGILEKVVQ